MKKTLSMLLFLTTLTLTLSACGAGKLEIEDYEWKMRTVMENNSEINVPAVGEPDAAHPDAKIVDMTLVAKDGKIIVTDLTNNKTYEGTYTVSGKSPKGTNYTVTIDGKEGNATVAMTEYADGSEEPTLPINLGDYSVYFYAE